MPRCFPELNQYLAVKTNILLKSSSEAKTKDLSISSQALYLWATALLPLAM